MAGDDRRNTSNNIKRNISYINHILTRFITDVTDLNNGKEREAIKRIQKRHSE